MPATERGPALAAALAKGGVIDLEEGTYTGAFVIGKSDTVLRAKPGARVVLTLRDPRFAAPNALWQPIAGEPDTYTTPELVGLGVHRLKGERVLFANDAAGFDYQRSQGVPVILRSGGATKLYLGGDDPRAVPLWVSAGDAAVLACGNAARVRIEGLDIRNGGAVGINAAACPDLAIEGNRIFGGRDGIRLKNGDSPRARIAGNWIVNHVDRRWWYRPDAKRNAAVEGSCIAAPGDHVAIEENVCEGWFNGIGMAPIAGQATIDPLIRGNLVRDIMDDAFELDGRVVRGKISGNLVLDAYVGFSLADRENPSGEEIEIHHNAVAADRIELGDRSLGACSGPPSWTGPACMFPMATKFNGAAASEIDFHHNTIVGFANAWRGSPSGGVPPVRTRVHSNLFYSAVAPLIRITGTAEQGNDWQGNAFHVVVGGANVFAGWAGQSSSYGTLATAKASPGGVAAGWEASGVQGDPLFVIGGQPSSLRAGSPAEGRGAFERAPLRVDELVELPTGWILARGAGFESDGRGLGLVDPIVVSSSTALARERMLLAAPTEVQIDEGDPSGR